VKDACLRRPISYALKEAKIVIGIRRNTENHARPPAPVTVRDLTFGLPMTATVQ
jgi:hypothetical protein